jgi:hypothetical protein
MAFTILFEGLMCHVGPDEFLKDHLAIVHEPGQHKPAIRISHADLIDKNDPTTIPLNKRDTVTFENLTAGQARTDALFRTRVPGLKKLIPAGKDLDPKVKGKAHEHAHVVAYVTYYAGDLSAPVAYKKKIRFDYDDGTSSFKQCVATGVKFTATPTNNVVVIIVTRHRPDGTPTGTPVRVEVRATATIIIENVSGAGNHFPMYRLLTNAAKMAKATKDSEDCEDPDPAATAALFVRKAEAEARAKGCLGYLLWYLFKKHKPTILTNPECTNSQWP